MINGVFLPKKRRFCFFKNRIRAILTKSFLTIIVKKRAFVKNWFCFFMFNRTNTQNQTNTNCKIYQP